MENPYSTPKSNLTTKVNKKPIGKWIAVVAAFGAGIYLAWWAFEYKQWVYLIYSLPYLIAGMALIMTMNWSQYMYYLLAIIGIGGWLYSTIKFPGWEYMNLSNSVISLIPGLLFVLLNIGVVILVYKYFHKT